MIKTERTQIHFLSDVLVVVTSLDLIVSITWLKSRAGKMKQIPRSDLLPERVIWAHLGISRFGPAGKRSLIGHVMYP